MIYEQNDNINKEIRIFESTKQKFWSWKYNNWNEKFTIGVQQQFDFSRQKKDEWTWKKNKWNYLIWGVERKKKEEKLAEPNRPVGHHQAEKHTLWNSQKEEREKQNRWLKEIMVENGPHLLLHMNSQI